MNGLILTLLLLPSIPECKVVVEPSPCERALAEEILVERDACSARLKVKDELIDELSEAALQPPPSPPSEFSLLGMPTWVTPVLAGVLLLSGVAIGSAL